MHAQQIGNGLVALAGAAAVARISVRRLAVGGGPAGAAAGPAAGAARLGAAPAAPRLTLDLPLKTDTAGLARFAAAVSDPSSPGVRPV